MPALGGSKTEQNLKDAFAGESQANRRYLYFARKADVEGHNDVSALFRSTAEGETGHAHGHLDFLVETGDPATGKPIGQTSDNLAAAVAGETHEYTDMYPGMARTARDEGFDEIADWFETLAEGREIPRRALPEGARLTRLSALLPCGLTPASPGRARALRRAPAPACSGSPLPAASQAESRPRGAAPADSGSPWRIQTECARRSGTPGSALAALGVTKGANGSTQASKFARRRRAAASSAPSSIPTTRCGPDVKSPLLQVVQRVAHVDDEAAGQGGDVDPAAVDASSPAAPAWSGGGW